MDRDKIIEENDKNSSNKVLIEKGNIFVYSIDKQKIKLKDVNWVLSLNDKADLGKELDMVVQNKEQLTQSPRVEKININYSPENERNDTYVNINSAMEGVNSPQNESESEPIKKPNILSTKLKILMLTANPAGTTKVNLDKEHSSIVLKLESKQDLFTLNLKKAVSGTEFKEFTETIKPDILHFSGHGEGGKYAGIIVQNDDKNDEELISIDGLDALFEYLNELNINIQLVLLNACYSDAQAQIIAKYVPYVIGTNVDIGDGIAIAFSTGFYYKLAELNNLDFGQAFKSGRTQAVMKGASKSNFIFFKDGKQEII